MALPSSVGRVPPRGVPVPPRGETIGPPANASGDPARPAPSPGVPNPNEPPPRRLRRLHRVWPDRDGNISYLLTICVEGRARVLDNDDTFQRLTAFLLDSPARYRWFGRRFVVMPDHIHLIAHMGQDAIRLGQWIKALKAVVGGLERCASHAAASVGRVPPRGVPVPPRGGPPVSAVSGDAAGNAVRPASVGRVPPRGVPVPSRGVPAVSPGASSHEFSRIKRSWRWQDGFHDHKFRTPESESRKWEYVCLNPVRYGLVNRPEQWPYGGEVFYDDAVRPRLLPGTPSLLETGLLIEEQTPREGTRPATL